MEIKDMLRNHVVEVRFVKKNGEVRDMLCTLMEDIIPETNGKRRNLPENMLTVFDIENNGWRTINLETLKFIHVVE